MTQIPQELDWVGKRAACSIEQVFADLMAGIERDVEAANNIFGATAEKPLFKVLKGLTETRFTVNRSGRIKNVTLSRTDAVITIVSDITGETSEYTFGMNDEGRCLMRRDGVEFEQWQVRKLALEGMFFGQ